MPSIELLFLCISSILALVVFVNIKSRNRNLPPGPFQWPFFGNVKEVAKLSRKLGGQHVALLEFHKRYDSPVISLKLGGSNLIVVSGAKCIHEVLSSEVYDGRPWNFFVQLRNMGLKKGITINDGPEWKEIRNWFNKNMRTAGFGRREMGDFIEREVNEVFRKIGDGGVRTIKTLISPIIINVLWSFATGRRFKEEKLKYFNDLTIRRARAFDLSGGTLSAYPWLRYVAPEWSGYNLLMTTSEEFKTILMDTINENKKNYKAGRGYCLIDMFLDEMYGGKGPEAGFDDDQLLIIMLDVLMGGLSITASVLEILFLNVLLHQDVQKKVHEEIDRIIGQEKFPAAGDRLKMPYTEAVLTESQRLVPVMPIIGPRRTMWDSKLLDYDIPRDSYILINIYSITSDPNLYPKPDTFNPERFLKNGARVDDDNMLHFGKGRRQCPGMPLAKSALFQVFTGILQRYEILPVPGQELPSLNLKPGITRAPEPYEVLFVPRNRGKTL